VSKVSTNQQGWAGGNVINIDGSGNQVTVGGPAPDESGQQEKPEESSGGGGKFVFVAVVVLAVLWMFSPMDHGSDSSNGQPDFPGKSDPYPTGATNPPVLSAVVVAVQSCAQAVVLKPANCPQSVGGYVSRPTSVHWTLYGDPGGGAYVRFSDGHFHVLGSAIMFATYASDQRPAVSLNVVRYWAQVEWLNGQAKFSSIRAYDGSPKLVVRKNDPKVPADAALVLVKQAFQRCVAGKKLPMAPDCPQGTGSSGDKATWTLNGDPSVNTHQTFDPATGLTHVKGSYSANARYSLPLLGNQTQTQSGDYDAVFVMGDGKPVLLQIKDA
jgi:hypothetical protein